MHSKKGSFAANNTTGNQSITGAGFQGEALILWCTRNIAEDWIVNQSFSIGFCASSSQRKTTGINGTNNATPSVSAKRMADLAISIISGTGTVQAEADFVSFDSDGFTINWTTAAVGKEYIIHYLVLGGTELTNVFVGDFLTGSVATNVPITGVGFKPDLIIMAGQNTSAALPYATTFGMINIGAGDNGLRTRSSSVDANHNVNPTQTSQWQTNEIQSSPQPGGGSIESEANLVSMDSDGFTINLSSAHNDRYAFIALKGGNYFIGSDTQKTSTGTQSKTGIGFTPAALLFWGCNAVSNASIDTTQSTLVFGGTDGTNEGCTWINDRDGVNPSDVHCQTTTTKSIRHAHESPSETIEGEADLFSMDSNGYTLNWTTSDGTAREFNFIAFGPAEAAAGLVEIRNPITRFYR